MRSSSDSQGQIIKLVSQAPQLLPPVSVPKKEAVFEQLVQLLARALRPVERQWYEGQCAAPPAAAAAEAERDGGAAPGVAAPAAGGAQIGEWAAFVRKELQFVYHAAEPLRLPVPSSRSARLVRLAAFVDLELCARLLRTQLLHKVLLFVPDVTAADPLCHPALVELKEGIEGAIRKLGKHCAPERA